MYRWSIQGPGANFFIAGILGVIGMGAYLLETDPAFTTGQFLHFTICRICFTNNWATRWCADTVATVELLEIEMYKVWMLLKKLMSKHPVPFHRE